MISFRCVHLKVKKSQLVGTKKRIAVTQGWEKWGDVGEVGQRGPSFSYKAVTSAGNLMYSTRTVSNYSV